MQQLLCHQQVIKLVREEEALLVRTRALRQTIAACCSGSSLVLRQQLDSLVPLDLHTLRSTFPPTPIEQTMLTLLIIIMDT